MTRQKEPYSLDPARRLDVIISEGDCNCTEADEIFAAAQLDVLSKRLYEVAWEEYRSQKKYVVERHDIVISRSLSWSH